MIDKHLLEILVCPVTKARLHLVGDELWSIANATAYPIRDGVPILLDKAARELTLEETESLK